MKQVAIKITLLILLLSLVLTLIACDDDAVDEGDQSTDVTSADAPNDGKPSEGGSNSDGTIDLPFVPF